MDPNIKYTKEMYNKYGAKYVESMKKIRFHNHYIEIPAVKNILGNVKNKKVLDIGCAGGTHSKILVKKGAIVTGMDNSENMVELAKKNVPKAKFIQGNMLKLPFPKNKFDIIFYGLCIHYVKDLNKVFKEANRVLKKNGRLIFSTHNPIFSGVKKLKIKNKKIYYIDNYFIKELSEWIMLPGMKLKTYQRTFSELINPLIEEGFQIKKVIEPKPIKEGKKANKGDYGKSMKKPCFIIVEAVKK